MRDPPKKVIYLKQNYQKNEREKEERKKFSILCIPKSLVLPLKKGKEPPILKINYIQKFCSFFEDLPLSNILFADKKTNKIQKMTGKRREKKGQK